MSQLRRRERLPSESAIVRHTATARNTGWCSEGAGKKHGQLPPPAFQFPAIPPVGKPYPMPAGEETRVIQSAEVWLLRHREGRKRKENGPGSDGYPERITSTPHRWLSY